MKVREVNTETCLPQARLIPLEYLRRRKCVSAGDFATSVAMRTAMITAALVACATTSTSASAVSGPPAMTLSTYEAGKIPSSIVFTLTTTLSLNVAPPADNIKISLTAAAPSFAVTPTGSLSTGSACTSGSQCVTGTCVGGCGITPCASGSGAMACAAPLLHDGAPCGANPECVSFNCANSGVCTASTTNPNLLSAPMCTINNELCNGNCNVEQRASAVVDATGKILTLTAATAIAAGPLTITCSHSLVANGAAGATVAGTVETSRDTTPVAVVPHTFTSPPPCPVVLDVRTASEFAGGHLSCAHNLPVQDDGALVESVKCLATGVGHTNPLHANVQVYCNSGGRAVSAVAVLQGQGFTSVTNAGGYGASYRAALEALDLCACTPHAACSAASTAAPTAAPAAVTTAAPTTHDHGANNKKERKPYLLIFIIIAVLVVAACAFGGVICVIIITCVMRKNAAQQSAPSAIELPVATVVADSEVIVAATGSVSVSVAQVAPATLLSSMSTNGVDKRGE